MSRVVNLELQFKISTDKFLPSKIPKKFLQVIIDNNKTYKEKQVSTLKRNVCNQGRLHLKNVCLLCEKVVDTFSPFR